MKAAIMGYGTIGSGVFEVLRENREQIEKKAGEPIEIKYVLDLRDLSGTPAEEAAVKDLSVIENDPEVSIVVETMGGTTPAYEFVKRCLLKGKHVVTSNKALVAAHGTELLRLAGEKGVNFLFEASDPGQRRGDGDFERRSPAGYGERGEDDGRDRRTDGNL